MRSRIDVCRTAAMRVTAMTAALLAGCAAVGPDYEAPTIETRDAWTEAIAGAVTADQTPGLQRWWQIFGDPVLTDLIEQARQSNIDIRLSVSRIAEARAQLGIADSAKLPSLDLDGGVAKTRASDDGVLAQVAPPGGFEAQGLYELGFDATWEIDVFGGVRRRVQAAGATYEATVDDERDVLVSLLAEVALNYVTLRSAQQRIMLTRANIDIQEQALTLAADRFNSGLSSKLDVVQARSNLAFTRAAMPLLEIQQTRALNRLATLLGADAGSLNSELSAAGTIPFPAAGTIIGAGVPADVLRQRPDVRAAERRLAAQYALIGVATADLYPRFGLSGDIGFQSRTIGNLLTDNSTTWSLGLPFEWNVFDGGKIRNNIRVQEERATQAELQYRQSVLLALEEVENAVVGFNQQNSRYEMMQEAVIDTQEAVRLVTVQYDAGVTDFNNVLTTQRSLFEQQDQVVTSEAQVVLELISLYKALGGGWDVDAAASGQPGDHNGVSQQH